MKPYRDHKLNCISLKWSHTCKISSPYNKSNLLSLVLTLHWCHWTQIKVHILLRRRNVLTPPIFCLSWTRYFNRMKNILPYALASTAPVLRASSVHTHKKTSLNSNYLIQAWDNFCFNLQNTISRSLLQKVQEPCNLGVSCSACGKKLLPVASGNFYKMVQTEP